MVKAQIKFSVLDFCPLTWKEWKVWYKSDIRVSVRWEKLKKAKVGLALADAGTVMFLPWYAGGANWLDDKPPLRAHVGNKDCIVRVPALKLKKGYLILDGCHRITELKPKLIYLDWIEADKRCFVDLRSLFWFNEELKAKGK